VTTASRRSAPIAAENLTIPKLTAQVWAVLSESPPSRSRQLLSDQDQAFVFGEVLKILDVESR
jgi:hypothetical protein